MSEEAQMISDKKTSFLKLLNFFLRKNSILIFFEKFAQQIHHWTQNSSLGAKLFNFFPKKFENFFLKKCSKN